MNIEIRVLDPRVTGFDYKSAGAAAIDLHACIREPLRLLPQAPALLIGSGIALNIGNSMVGAFMFARSGLGHKKGLVLGLGTGVIDSDYQGEVFISAWNRNPAPFAMTEREVIIIEPMERIAQLVFVPILRPEFNVVGQFSAKTARGEGGFGSTGTK